MFAFSWVDWIPAISTTAAVAFAGAVIAPLYKAAIEKGIQHRLDKELESIRSQFRREEETQKQLLKSQDEKILALRSGALSGVASRSIALDKRRLEAVENLWISASSRGSLKAACMMTKSLKLFAFVDAAELGKPGSEANRELAEAIFSMCNLIEPREKPESLDRERPFVSPLAWAIYSAHSIVITLPVIWLNAARAGVGTSLLRDPTELLQSVKSVLPAFSSFIEEHGPASFPYLIDPLEDFLLAELRHNLEGTESDEKAIQQAAAILRAADAILRTQ